VIPGAALVKRLLEYLEQLEKLKIRPAFEVPRTPFVAHQHELLQLPDLAFNLQSDGDDVWLRFPRLDEIPPPPPSAFLSPWVTLPKDPSRKPELRLEIANDGNEPAFLKLEDHPKVETSFEWYLGHLWAPWAETEAPRRKARALYNRLFELQQTLVSDGAESPLELVWGVGYATWRKQGCSTPVRHPLITQVCEVALNPRTYDLEIRPRSQDPTLEIDCYAAMDVIGVRPLEAGWRAALTAAADRINPFDDSTFAGILRTAVGHLDAGGTFRTGTGGSALPQPAEHLQVTDAWVLFARKRSADILLRDIERLKDEVEKATELPPVVRALVTRGSDSVSVNPEIPFRGLSNSDSTPESHELYFPMAYNDEQVSIVGKLQSNDGVVVQGPPGTGKTHTIANVICHYLAQGKRVLVTSKGESALAVLQDKLPEKIRPLSVALLASDREGMKQFERSIQQIAATVTAYIPTRAERAIKAAEADLDRLHGKIAMVDRQIADAATNHLRAYEFHGESLTAVELARVVVAQAATHAWFDDELTPRVDSELPFDAAELATLKRCRLEVGTSLEYLEHSLPNVSELPSAVELVSLHHDLVSAGNIQAEIAAGDVLALIDAQTKTFERARALLQFMLDRNELRSRLANAGLTWTPSLVGRMCASDPSDAIFDIVYRLCGEVQGLENERRSLLAHAVAAPEDAELDDDYREALRRLLAGQKAFVLPIGKASARKQLADTRVGGESVRSPDGWALVNQLIQWRVESRKLVARWRVVAGELGLDTPADHPDASVRSLALWAAHVMDARRLAHEFELPLKQRTEEVFGASVGEAVAAGDESVERHVISSLRSHVERNKLAYATERVAAVRTKLSQYSGGVVQQADTVFVEMLGKPDNGEAEIYARWSELLAELDRLNRLRPALGEIQRVCFALQSAGAQKWAARLRATPAAGDDDAIPDTWRAAWRWRQACTLLEQIDGHEQLRKLFNERKSLTSHLERTYQELVSEKAWLGVYLKSPESVRQALQKYLSAIQSLGAGTGVRSGRHRRDARVAMEDAYKAVPCWVLPHWRVSEALPAELGLFDLVIVDEASQSDISALPALMRGKTLLVVGDDKQVSPSAVGVAEVQILDLRDRFLAEQPHGALMTPDKSMYDLASVMFAGNAVMLKEHFRSVPAIIEFSNRTFYGGHIKPLRVPRTNERLDPPLIDVFVKGGVRNAREVNEAEAQAVVQEIQSILSDPDLAGRSIGVVTLLGHHQAARITTLVNEHVSQVDIVERQIAVGAPPIFQGRERDIMLVSMVLGHGDRAVNTVAGMEQRFNVALSRARDRMILFRSLLESDLRDNSLNSLVLQHFKQPFRQDARKVADLKELCESPFEHEMFDELTRRGYRVTPQVRSGGFRIDFVVEGSEGRRLAIECDGDKYHGPEQWREDMQRQRVLERAGWTFWRCFGSSFVRRRQEVLDDLFSTLSNLGIDPIGADTIDASSWVAYKEVDPLNIDGVDDADDTASGIDPEADLEPDGAMEIA
jgi:very-short-patch-repair endonuclease